MVVVNVDASAPFFAGAADAAVGASAAIKEVAAPRLVVSSASLAPGTKFLSCHF